MIEQHLEMKALLERVVEKLVAWGTNAFTLIPNLVVACIILVLFWFVGRVAQRTGRATVHRLNDNEQLAVLVGAALRIAITCLGLFIGLEVLNLDKTVTSLLAGVGVLGIALGFALQDVTANFMAGVMMSLRRYPFVNGDLIQTGDMFGNVENLHLRSTTIRRMTGELVIVPNKDIFQNPLINFSDAGFRRVDLEVGVAYREDLEKVERVALEALRAIRPRMEERDVEVFFKAFGDSAITFDARMWVLVQKNPDFLKARSHMVMALKRAFDDNDIKIPFPIRTLEFGDVGGDKLDAMLHVLRPDRAA